MSSGLSMMFPEQKCSGFIEADFDKAVPIIYDRFPEQKCSGFIEASNTGKSLVVCISFPEQKCSGFIEASIQLATRTFT